MSQRLFYITGLVTALIFTPGLRSETCFNPAIEQPDKQSSKPKLLVQITVDQLRSEILTRMRPMFSGGLKRMLNQGFYIEKGEVAHGHTLSHPGHGSIATGSYPSTHGLVTNDVWVYNEEQGWHWEEMMRDKQEHIVPYPDREGASPRVLKVPTIGTWMKWQNTNSQSISMSNSNFAAVTQAGWVADGSYWYDSATGTMVTSSYYMSELPTWVKRHNEGALEQAIKSVAWDLTVPEQFRHLARADNASFENTDSPNANTFPHRVDLSALEDADNSTTEFRIKSDWFAQTPFVDELLLDFAKEAVKNHCMGQDGDVDYLHIGIGATDNVGHNYGAMSLEQLDNMKKLDKALGTFFDFLDEHVGEGRYLVALTSDHGSPDVLESRIEKGLPAKRISRTEIDGLLVELKTIGEAHKGDDREIVDKIEFAIEAKPYVAEALTQDELMGRQATDYQYIDLMRASYSPGISPEFPIWGTSNVSRQYHPGRYGIWVIFKEYMHFDYAASVHGSPYQYDRSVPILFYGAGVRKGQTAQARTIDVAPTISAIAGIPVPGSVDGKVLDITFDSKD